MVTKNTLPTHVWSLPKSNIYIDNKEAYIEPVAIILAVSRENGIDHIETHKKSITAIKFRMFLENLRSKYPLDNIILVMDHLGLHLSNAMKNRMDELGLMYTYTPIASP